MEKVFCKKEYRRNITLVANIHKPYHFMYRIYNTPTPWEGEEYIGAIWFNENDYSFITGNEMKEHFCTIKEYRKLKLNIIKNT